MSDELSLEKQILLVAQLLHTRMMAIADEADARGQQAIAHDIRDLKLQLANAMTLIVLQAQERRIKQKILG